MKRLSIAVTALILGITVAGVNARAESQSCEQGRSCELGAKPPGAKFKPGMVDGAAVWQSGGRANLWFTSTTTGTTTYTVAICGAASVEEVMFEGGVDKDAKVVSPKGKLSGCDVYNLQTGVRIDGLRIKPNGNSFKVVVRKNDSASGYSMFLEGAVVPAREGHYHFRMAE